MRRHFSTRVIDERPYRAASRSEMSNSSWRRLPRTVCTAWTTSCFRPVGVVSGFSQRPSDWASFSARANWKTLRSVSPVRSSSAA